LPTDSDGLNPFVQFARERIEAAHGPMDFEIAIIPGPGAKWKYIRAQIPGTTSVVSIASDGAQIWDGDKELFWSEYYDYDTPEQLVERLSGAISSLKSPDPAVGA
jgi:hypothetical protein